VATAIARLPALISLDLSSNAIAARGAAALAPLSAITSLRALNVGGNKLQCNGASALAPTLSALAPGLVSFEIGRNWLRSQGARALAPHLSRMAQLQRLGLAWNALGMGGTWVALRAVSALSTLQHIDLAENDVYDKGVALFVNFRSKQGALPALKRLDLSGNFITEVGVAALLPALPGFQHLDLRMNAIGDAGLGALVDAAPTALAQMTCLDVGGCDVGREAAAECAGKLAAFPHLQHRGLQQRPRRR
jgi:Ran GTPase-activating protein (RanGAP) involved in mRNA processing and transport